jgi:transposase
MANRLKMAKIQVILELHHRGWSQRRIAQELGIDRETVGRYVGLAAGELSPGESNPAISPAGKSPKKCGSSRFYERRA